MTELPALLSPDALDTTAIAAALDAMGHEQRVAATRSIPRRAFPKLFEALRDRDPVPVSYFVPDGHGPDEVVRHIGINSLLMFRTFEKPMYKTADGAIGGRNHQFWSWFTGPGYFTVKGADAGGRNESFFDYRVLPSSAPRGWPGIRSNSFLFSYFVYHDMVDYMRQVSTHVTIGEAWRGDKNRGMYFILVRAE